MSPRKAAAKRGTTWAAVCKLVMKLPGVEIGTSYGTPSLHVRKTFLARLKEDGETIAIRVGFDDRDVLLELDPAAFYLTDHYRDYPAMLVRLKNVQVGMLEKLFVAGVAASGPEESRGKTGERVKMRSRVGAGVVVGVCLFVGGVPAAQSQVATPAAEQKGATAMTRVTGTFDVRLMPQPPDDKAQDPSLARMSIDKQFHGDLEATSKGTMLSAGTAVKGSAGYVAIEKVTGALQGRNGSFALQHSGTLTRGTPQLAVGVVPDSGTGELVGLTGTMTIDIAAESTRTLSSTRSGRRPEVFSGRRDGRYRPSVGS